MEVDEGSRHLSSCENAQKQSLHKGSSKQDAQAEVAVTSSRQTNVDSGAKGSNQKQIKSHWKDVLASGFKRNVEPEAEQLKSRTYDYSKHPTCFKSEEGKRRKKRCPSRNIGHGGMLYSPTKGGGKGIQGGG